MWKEPKGREVTYDISSLPAKQQLTEELEAMDPKLNSSAENTAHCKKCGLSYLPLQVPHVKRRCSDCGAVVHVVEPGEHGGILIRTGDRFVIPAGFIRLSLDREKASGTFSREGMNWFIRELVFGGMPNTSDELQTLLADYKQQADELLENSTLFEGLDLESEGGAEEVLNILDANKDTPEWWATLVSVLKDRVELAVNESDAQRAAWEAIRMANSRAMLIIARDIEKVLWRGYTVEELAEVQSTIEHATRPLMIVEGETDTAFITTAFELLGRADLLERLDIQWVGRKEGGRVIYTGKDALNNVAALARAKPDLLRQRLLLLYDCDAHKPAEDIGLLSVRSIPPNLNNTIAKKGIENIFPEHHFNPDSHPEYYANRVKIGEYGERTTIGEFRKMEFCRFMCEQQRNPADFEGFSVIVDIVEEWLGMHDRNTNSAESASSPT